MSQVAGPPPQDRAAWRTADRAGLRTDLLILVLLVALVAGFKSYSPALLDPDEPRSALAARLMVETGDWLAPHLPDLSRPAKIHYPLENGVEAYWDKPPLYFWTVAGLMKVLGPTALAARLPSALGHLAAVLLVYAVGRHLWGRRAGLLGGMVLAVSLLPVLMAHVARLDMLLTALMTAMLLATVRLLDDRPRDWFWTMVLYGAAGLVILAKGPALIVLPAAAIGGAVLLSRRWRDLWNLRPIEGLILMLAIAAPWFVYMHFRYPPTGDPASPGFTYAFFYTQNLARATGESLGHVKVPGYLVGILLAGMLPWAVFIPAVARRLGRQAWQELRRRPAVMLLWLWTAAVVAAFSVSKTQLEHYILPAMPPLAALIGAYLAERTAARDRDRWFTAGLWLMLIGGLLSTAVMVALLTWNQQWTLLTVALAAALGGILVSALKALRQEQRRHSIYLSTAWMAAFVVLVLAADPLGNEKVNSTLAEAAIIAEQAGPQDRVLGYPHSPYSFVWHMWPRDVSVYDSAGRRVDQAGFEDLLRECRQRPTAAAGAGATPARRTFCLLLSAADLEELQRQTPPLPIKVLLEKPARRPLVEMFKRLLQPAEGRVKRSKTQALIVVEPPGPPPN